MVVLYLNTVSEETKIGLIDENGDFIICESHNLRFSQSEKLLLTIDDILTKKSIKRADISAIVAETGPGGYTGLRVGLTIANTLAFSLNLPIFDSFQKFVDSKQKKFDKPIMPKYATSPIITKSKPRL
jgi:tRNA threonylcarbamoyladenosine biosynthesis protein TsaB